MLFSVGQLRLFSHSFLLKDALLFIKDGQRRVLFILKQLQGKKYLENCRKVSKIEIPDWEYTWLVQWQALGMRSWNFDRRIYSNQNFWALNSSTWGRQLPFYIIHVINFSKFADTVHTNRTALYIHRCTCLASLTNSLVNYNLNLDLLFNPILGELGIGFHLTFFGCRAQKSF